MISASMVEKDLPRLIPTSIALCNSMSVVMSTSIYVRVGNRTAEAERASFGYARPLLALGDE
jgi:hypothetical protein